jgi:four helix bundle protein
MMHYERLDAWKATHELAVAVYKATGTLPKSELYGLTSQLRRASYSVPANIAEGSAKRGPAEFRRHLDIAVGSLAEICYGLRLATDLTFLTSEQSARLEELRSRAAQLTWGLHRAITRKARAPK